jgi:hypothetical protein
MTREATRSRRVLRSVRGGRTALWYFTASRHLRWKAASETYARTTPRFELRPFLALSEGIEGGFTVPPEETGFEIHKDVTA